MNKLEKYVQLSLDKGLGTEPSKEDAATFHKPY